MSVFCDKWKYRIERGNTTTPNKHIYSFDFSTWTWITQDDLFVPDSEVCIVFDFGLRSFFLTYGSVEGAYSSSPSVHILIHIPRNYRFYHMTICSHRNLSNRFQFLIRLFKSSIPPHPSLIMLRRCVSCAKNIKLCKYCFNHLLKSRTTTRWRHRTGGNDTGIWSECGRWCCN